MTQKLTMSLSEEDYKLISDEANKLQISVQMYMRIFAVQAARTSAGIPLSTSADDLFGAIERVLIQTQGIANLLTVTAGESAFAAAGVRRILKLEHPGLMQSILRQSKKVRVHLEKHWKRVLELSK